MQLPAGREALIFSQRYNSREILRDPKAPTALAPHHQCSSLSRQSSVKRASKAAYCLFHFILTHQTELLSHI